MQQSQNTTHNRTAIPSGENFHANWSTATSLMEIRP
jgi:hypothetical protein